LNKSSKVAGKIGGAVAAVSEEGLTFEASTPVRVIVSGPFAAC